MTSDLKSATLNTRVSMCIQSPTASEALAISKQPQRSYDLKFEISNLDYPGIHVHNASEATAATKRPRRSYDLRFEISNLEYPGIHVHIVSNDLRGHGGLQTTSEVI